MSLLPSKPYRQATSGFSVPEVAHDYTVWLCLTLVTSQKWLERNKLLACEACQYWQRFRLPVQVKRTRLCTWRCGCDADMKANVNVSPAWMVCRPHALIRREGDPNFLAKSSLI